MSKEQFAELVERALAELPPDFAAFIEEVPVEIREQATPEQKKLVHVKSDGLLLGLYRGRPRTVRSVLDSGAVPDVIYIFQRAVELVSKNEESLIKQVRTTVLHEIGHHFGMTEDDLRALGYA